MPTCLPNSEDAVSSRSVINLSDTGEASSFKTHTSIWRPDAVLNAKKHSTKKKRILRSNFRAPRPRCHPPGLLPASQFGVCSEPRWVMELGSSLFYQMDLGSFPNSGSEDCRVGPAILGIRGRSPRSHGAVAGRSSREEFPESGDSMTPQIVLRPLSLSRSRPARTLKLRRLQCVRRRATGQWNESCETERQPRRPCCKAADRSSLSKRKKR